jgi:hypothetical protein
MPGIHRHHSVFYYFYSRARWLPDEPSRHLFQLTLQLLPEHLSICLTVDDTLSRKSGPQIFGGGMHHDPLLSNYGRGKTLVKFFSFGLNWVILCVVIPLPWNTERFMAIPITGITRLRSARLGSGLTRVGNRGE